jgi:hypothetical protein
MSGCEHSPPFFTFHFTIFIFHCVFPARHEEGLKNEKCKVEKLKWGAELRHSAVDLHLHAAGPAA